MAPKRLVVRRATRALAQAEGRPRQGRPKVQGKRTLVVATDLVCTYYRAGYPTYRSGVVPTVAPTTEVQQTPSSTSLNANPIAPTDK